MVGAGSLRDRADMVKPTPSIELAESIERWCDSTGVPVRIAYGVALVETGWKGPDHADYDPRQKSPTGAIGPMQVTATTAAWLTGIPRAECSHMLMDSIDFNVQCSVTYLKRLHDRRGSWAVALGEYNTGYPVVNEYARKALKREPW